VNLAKGRTAEASNIVNYNYAADRAIDGKISTQFRSLKHPDDWWRVDLDDVILVRRIVIGTGSSKC